jgi:transcriptional regulator with XRE-family HTH domain
VNTFSEVWSNFGKSKKYREAFAFSLFKRMVPFQIRALRRQRGWSQEQLATTANLTQGVISRAEDPDYGNLTINTIRRIAAGFDVAFVVKFVPFSELDKWFLDLSEKSAEVPSFAEEDEALAIRPTAGAQAATEDDRVAELVKATVTNKQSKEGLVDIELHKQNMNNILSGRPQMPAPPRLTHTDRSQELGARLCS